MPSRRRTHPTPNRPVILANGENLVHEVPRRRQMIPPPLPRSFDVASAHLTPQIVRSLNELNSLPSSLKQDEGLVLCLRLHPDMLAKTYEPESLFRRLPTLRNVGSRRWEAPLAEVAQTRKVEELRQRTNFSESRILFIQSTLEGFQSLLSALSRSEPELTGGFVKDICKIERFDLLEREERLYFEEDWTDGRVELVFHPPPGSPREQTDFLHELFEQNGINDSKAVTRQYPDGPTFVSVKLDHSEIQKLGRCNALRAARPLKGIKLPSLRAAQQFAAPPAPSAANRSGIKVGMFDGGVDTNVPHLRHFVEEDAQLSIATPHDSDAIAHGTAVAGALLYGSLDRHSSSAPLPTPKISVVSIRVLPTNSPADFDLYEVIDLIERAVPQRGDVTSWNVSLGPPGPITDDPISRFTWVIDDLSFRYRVTFLTAVGNDGDLPGLDARIQSPSDAVHGIAVGALTKENGVVSRAKYSCKGPGREGGKVKPDLLCFGGSDSMPFHLLSTSGNRIHDQGTSFATPVASALHGELRGRFTQAQPLLARVLLVHSAIHPAGKYCSEFGFGCLPEGLEEILSSEATDVTVVYQGRIETSKYHRLRIPLPETVKLPGRVTVRFTLGALCPLDVNHAGDYTSCCIEDSFVPNWQIYEFYPPKGTNEKIRTLHLIDNATEVNELLQQKWKQSQLPKTKGAKGKIEADLRSQHLKWDTMVRRMWTSQTEDGLHEPSMILHPMHRRDKLERVEYAAAVTLSAPKYKGDLFADVRTRFPVLVPITLRSQAEIQVPITT